MSRTLEYRTQIRKWLTPGVWVYSFAVTALLACYAPWELVDPVLPFSSTPLNPAPIWSERYLSQGANVEWNFLAVVWFGLVGTPVMLYLVWRRESSTRAQKIEDGQS
jgi:hypothetical protein